MALLPQPVGRTHRTVGFLVLLSVTMITLDTTVDGGGGMDGVRAVAADALSPVRSVAEDVLGPVGDGLAGITGYGALEDENAALRARLADAEGGGLREAEAERELREALDLLDIGWVGDVPTVGARVVAAPISNFEQTVELGRGSSAGIEPDMPVVAADGLVGRVVSVSKSRSVVQLVTDPDLSVGVRLTGSGDDGAADGEGRGQPLSVSFVETATRVERRELVVTSGLEGALFPGGLPVGHVLRAGTGPGQLSQQVELEPAADLDHLEVVRVLRWRSP